LDGCRAQSATAQAALTEASAATGNINDATTQIAAAAGCFPVGGCISTTSS